MNDTEGRWHPSISFLCLKPPKLMKLCALTKMTFNRSGCNPDGTTCCQGWLLLLYLQSMPHVARGSRKKISSSFIYPQSKDAGFLISSATAVPGIVNKFKDGSTAGVEWQSTNAERQEPIPSLLFTNFLLSFSHKLHTCNIGFHWLFTGIFFIPMKKTNQTKKNELSWFNKLF